ncbi:MAG: DUF1365 domain-containing protein [Alphaproteobacteria bacterium]|nr:DUF1365 domain-containing protein [Alphaproteobacteria bacterium]
MGVATSTPQIFFGKVMHARLLPKKNAFRYGIYYLTLPLSQRTSMPIAYNRFAPLSFYDRDHGACDGSDLEHWARDILNAHNITKADGEIILMCMPRIFGYTFNPVSFWLCHDKDNNIRAILCEVHNTFGEHHTYICAHDDQRPIHLKDTMEAEKIFHVSPFLKREGRYTFRFDIENEQFSTWIDFYDGDNNKQLVTSLIGENVNMTKRNLQKAFWTHPLLTFKAITLIHWQALKLVAKGIKYISKPKQKDKRISKTKNLTNL